MPRGKDAILVLGLIVTCGLGCASGGPRRPAVAERSAPRPLPPALARTQSPELLRSGPAAQPPVTNTQAVTPAAAPAPPVDHKSALQALVRAATERYATIDSYIARLRRREQINGKDQPEELILFKFRKQPWSVHMKWIGVEARGREVLCVKGQHGSQLHTRLAAGDVPLMPAGKRMAFAPDSALVRSSSRHPISKAGIGNLIERFGLVVAAWERGDTSPGTLTYHGLTRRPEFAQPCATVELVLPPGRDATLPQGGRRWYFFDPVTRFPSLLITLDHAGRAVEYYCYDRFELGVRLDDHDFNPDGLWGK